MNEITIIDTPSVIINTPRSPDTNPAIVYLASLPAKSGRRTQKQVLGVIAGWLGGDMFQIEWGALRYAHTAAIRTHIMEKYAPSTARKMLCALRGTLKSAWRLGQISAEEYAKAVDLGKVSGTSLPAGRYIEDAEVEAIFKVCATDITPSGARDAALFAVLLGCGLRRAELVDLDIADLNLNDETLLVCGKRNKERLVYAADGIGEALHDWLLIRTMEPGPLFLAVNKFHRVRYGERLTPQTVYNVLRKRIAQAGVNSFSPHSLRRTFCSKLLDMGVDVITTSKLMGHSNLQTTMIYDKRGDRTAKAGAKLMQIPYIKRGDAI